MKTYKLTRPFDDGLVVHPRGAILQLAVAPKSAKVITAKEIAAEKTVLTAAEDTVKSADRAKLKAELLAELKAELAEGNTKADEAVAEAKAANDAAAAAVTGGVDNDGKPLADVTKTPAQKAGVKK